VKTDEESNSGPGDVEIGTKYTWMDVTEGFHVAVAFEVQFPTGDIDKELTEGFIEYEPSIIVAKDFPANNSQVFLQAGFGFVDRNKSPDDPDEEEPAAHEFNLNVGFFVPMDSVTWTTELNLSTNTWNNGGEEEELYLTPGVIWKFHDTVEVGVGIPIGLNDGADNYRAIGMVTAEWD